MDQPVGQVVATPLELQLSFNTGLFGCVLLWLAVWRGTFGIIEDQPVNYLCSSIVPLPTGSWFLLIGFMLCRCL